MLQILNRQEAGYGRQFDPFLAPHLRADLMLELLNLSNVFI